MSEQAVCNLCGEPMPAGETMFKYHGYSGPCPKPPLPKRRFRKKPVVIEAVQWFKHGDHPAVQQYSKDTIENYPKYAECGFIQTLESGQNVHHVIPSDWIITGVKGEHYACKADIFNATYEAAEN